MRCIKKIKFPSRPIAKEALRKLKKDKPDYRGHTYHCAKCGYFHVGRKRRVLKQLRRKTAKLAVQ